MRWAESSMRRLWPAVKCDDIEIARGGGGSRVQPCVGGQGRRLASMVTDIGRCSVLERTHQKRAGVGDAMPPDRPHLVTSRGEVCGNADTEMTVTRQPFAGERERLVRKDVCRDPRIGKA